MPSIEAERQRYGAGRFNEPFRLLKPTVTRDRFGGEVVSYPLIGRIWGRRGIDTTYTVLDAGQAIERTVIDTRWDSRTGTGDHLLDRAGSIWIVENIEPVGRRRYARLNVKSETGSSSSLATIDPAHPVHPGTHYRYMGWSDNGIIDQAELDAAAQFTS